MKTHNYGSLRLVVGNCSNCNDILIVPNNGEGWSPVHCQCSWEGGIDAIKHGILFSHEPPIWVDRERVGNA